MQGYWPGIDNDIDNVILSCQLCQDHLPLHPFQEIAVITVAMVDANS